MTREQVRSYLELYRDLGFDSVYKRVPASAEREKSAVEASAVPAGAALPGLAPENDTLDQIRLDIGDCKRCRLCEARHSIVFGSGNERSSLVFVGEGPGAEEDEQGLPFVGRAGQLLTQMIENTAAKEGIPDTPQRRIHLQRCEVPPSGEPHAAAG